MVSLVNSPKLEEGSIFPKVETKLVDDEGIMTLPSSSEKDDDALSDSSNEVERLALQTLEHMPEVVSINLKLSKNKV